MAQNTAATGGRFRLSKIVHTYDIQSGKPLGIVPKAGNRLCLNYVGLPGLHQKQKHGTQMAVAPLADLFRSSQEEDLSIRQVNEWRWGI